MKIYNIRNSRSFFERLAECSGKVEIIGQNGEIVDFSEKGEKFAGSTLSCYSGFIPSIELRFQYPEDMDDMLGYIMNQRNIA